MSAAASARNWARRRAPTFAPPWPGRADTSDLGDVVALDDDVHRAAGRRAGAVDEGSAPQNESVERSLALGPVGRGGDRLGLLVVGRLLLSFECRARQCGEQEDQRQQTRWAEAAHRESLWSKPIPLSITAAAPLHRAPDLFPYNPLRENRGQMPARSLFNERELEAVKQAVTVAEGETSGEIVPYVVDASDAYEGSLWKGAALGALGAALVAAVVHAVAGLWGAGALWIGLPAAAGGALGFLLAAFVPAAKRSLVPPDVLTRRVRRRAAVAFLDEEVFSTEDRTGILLFLSLFECRVVVLGDAGISSKVGEEEWVAITEAIAGGIRDGRAGEALVEGISACGRLLARRGVEIRLDDRNELRDDLRRRDR